MIIKRVSILFLFLITCFANNLFSQLSPYYGVLYPNDNIDKFTQSVGSKTYALPDFSFDIQNNPACLFFLEHSQVFTSLSYEFNKFEISDYKIFSKQSSQEFELPNKNYYYPGYFSGVFKPNSFKRKFVIATVIKKVYSSGYDEIWLQDKRPTELIFLHERNGHVWNWSLGFGYQLTSDFIAAISYSRWFGNWHWSDKTKWETVLGQGKFNYNGQVFNFGMFKRFKKLSICGVFHTPFALMKSNDITIEWWGSLNKHNIKQSYDSSFKLGISYQLNNNLLIASGYRFQGQISIKNHEKLNRLWGNSENEGESIYGNSHQISVGSEYLVKILKKEIPVSFIYWLNYYPDKIEEEKFFNDISYGYRNYSVDGQNKFSNNVALSISFPINVFYFHFNCQWQSNSIYIHNRTSPPDYQYSIADDSYKLKRSNFILNVGVAIILKKVG